MRWKSTLLALFVAGLAGEVAFEAYAFLISPVLFGLTLEPARLVAGLAQLHAGLALDLTSAFVLHVFAGAVLFPLGYLAFIRLTPIPTPTVAGVVWGVILWAFAQGVLAPLVSRPPFMGFGPYTLSSLVAHPLLTLVTAVVYHRLVGTMGAVPSSQASVSR